MCGIAGVIGRSDTECVERMLNATRHRGPDDSGTFSDSYLTIGMNRLAIIDLSHAGHQPMTSFDDRYWIVFNGEVFNFREIKDQLKRRGYSFRSHTDTEVILNAYIEYGPRCLEFFRGMFAFIIYDTHTRDVFGARDRFGIKPFYYAINNDVFVFASELKGLLASGYVDFSVHPGVLKDVLLLGAACTSGETMVIGIKSIEPAHYFFYRDGEMKVTRYWSLGMNRVYNILSYPEAKETLIEKLKESLSLRLIGDRPMGLFLSSGIDSAALAVAACLLGRTDLLTFTLGFEGETSVFDESAFAGKIARHLGMRHKIRRGDVSGFEKLFNSFVLAIDQPSIDGFNTFLISEFARQDLVVALSGLGGDELMGGYLRDRAILDWNTNAQWIPDRAIKFLNKLAYSKLFSQGYPKAFFRSFRAKDPVWNYFLTRLLNDFQKVNSLLIDSSGTLGNKFLSFEDPRQTSFTVSQQVSLLELSRYMTPQLLRDMDAVSMYNSMEVRFPLIDHQFAEFIFSLPDDFKVDRISDLKVYKEGMHSYNHYGAKKILIDSLQPFLPVDYFETKKRGFRLPINEWVNAHFKEEISDTLTPSNSNTKYFKPEALISLRKSYQEKGMNNLVYLVFLFLKWEKSIQMLLPSKKGLGYITI